jgi:hypothetical protein
VLLAEVNLKKYPFTCSEDRLVYYFESIGPKGVIKKIVKYSSIDNNDLYFNLAFGDLNETTGQVEDRVVSGNGDVEMILATIATIVMEFMSYYPSKRIFMEGSTRSRTRLYQIGIAKNWKEIGLLLDIFGYRDGIWDPFKINVNYSAFAAHPKRVLKT